MYFFIYCFICFSSCFAGDLDEGGGRHLKRVPSIDCPNILVNTVKLTVAGSEDPVTLVFDFDDVLVKSVGQFGQEVTVVTKFAKQLDSIITNPDFAKNISGILILTARLARPIVVGDPMLTHHEKEVDLHRKEVMLTTNSELERCVPNIAAFLRSAKNFGGLLPDYLRYTGDEDYRKDGYTADCKNGFIWNCGIVVMGGAMDSDGELRHCKRFSLNKFLKTIPQPPGSYNILYIDDQPKWLAEFAAKGLGEWMSMHLFHYDAPVGERHKPVMRRQLPAYHAEDTSEIDVRSLISTAFRAAVSCAIKIAVVAYAINKVHSLRQYRIVRHFEHVLKWAFHLTLNCMRRLAFKILFDRR